MTNEGQQDTSNHAVINGRRRQHAMRLAANVQREATNAIRPQACLPFADHFFWEAGLSNRVARSKASSVSLLK
jgi:hypothetical protein